MPIGWRRITREEWRLAGGLRNSDLMRQADANGRWWYYRRLV